MEVTCHPVVHFGCYPEGVDAAGDDHQDEPLDPLTEQLTALAVKGVALTVDYRMRYNKLDHHTHCPGCAQTKSQRADYACDDGIDGVINQDVLGVDKIYIQAKRYADNHSVTAGDLRNFIGALDMCRAVKGVFVTTSSFTADAKNTVKKASKNIVLIDGAQLTQLMIKYGVGCKTKETVLIQKIDEDFFEEM